MAILEIQEATIKFGGLTAVNKVNMSINSGEIRALIGPNGAGKSTLFNAITGIHQVTSGQVFFKGQNITGLKPYQITGIGISRTFQNILLFEEMTVIENVMVGLHCRTKTETFEIILGLPGVKKEEKECREKSIELLEFVGLADKMNEKARNLPYGPKRLLEIARALASEPKVLLLDEPAAGMNYHEAEDLIKYVGKIRSRNITVMLVEHNMKVVMGISDHVTVLDHGEKIAEGVPSEIQSNEQVIEAYLGRGAH
ncbi:MAG TPA: ABC transporter ATP-binding protein [Firmicutes bacterium]|jgi:branched-chain amino acid transport system ATP-binding protein|nr:ABC transporter ATP-binding protein [Bacillota bacterium]